MKSQHFHLGDKNYIDRPLIIHSPLGMKLIKCAHGFYTILVVPPYHYPFEELFTMHVTDVPKVAN